MRMGDEYGNENAENDPTAWLLTDKNDENHTKRTTDCIYERIDNNRHDMMTVNPPQFNSNAVKSLYYSSNFSNLNLRLLPD